MFHNNSPLKTTNIRQTEAILALFIPGVIKTLGIVIPVTKL